MPVSFADLIDGIKSDAKALPGKPRIMEVCGTHTAALFRHGIRDLLGEELTIVSGPGCPVCVTPDATVDAMIAYARQGCVIATFGDMLRVPGAETSLAGARAEGADVRVVTSPLQVLEIAEANAERRVVFLGVGFETTAPGTGLLLREAADRGLDNLYVLSAHKLIAPAMRALLDAGESRIAGFLCPGHVAAVTGLAPFAEISAAYRVPCVVTGFEARDILAGISAILRQLTEGRSQAENAYPRAVRPEGNRKAQMLLEQVFAPVDSAWRGLGVIPRSGLALAEQYGHFAAERRLGIDLPPSQPRPSCLCGEVLRGVIDPSACPEFGAGCRPESPLGPCMVSTEGTCGIHYREGIS